ASARHDAAREYHAIGEHRVARDWEALPEAPSAAHEGELTGSHPYAADLDVVGRVSLIQLLDVTSRAPGRSTLLGWLLESAPSAGEIRERQAAASELASRDEVREELGVLARLSRAVGPRTLERFAEWCESPPWLLERPALLWAGRIITAATILAFLLQAAGVLTWPLWAITATVGLFLILGARAGLAESVKVAGVPSEQLRHHAAMLRLILDGRWESPRMQQLRDSLQLHGQSGQSGRDAAGELARLERIVAFAEVRHSPMLHLALQWLFVWDVHVAAALERWRRDAGVHVRGWLQSLGEAESLAALGTLSHDNPAWCFPDITESADAVESVVEGERMGHPLLPDGGRVPNDVTVGPPGSFLLITGSNMSGKSTLLRAIGANVVLALAGAPVCAARFRTPLVDVRTSIRIQDSLERGISLFMAELQRLRAVVDAARDAPEERGNRVLYLLDEMLHGTNTAERQIAARIVIGHLLHAGAIGAVTTHDLSLASTGELASAARPVHFTEQFDRTDGRTVMTFDYRLRPGLATSANALALLDLVGLGAE
ncbi:MAG TPA: hypothetical protein VFK39_16040, partial [Gemmatimonadaceae bacterium]|nr:hypothetical protein [Gemmatimonadaceae bacterium]